jgi:lipoate-protein ligase A
VANCSSNTVTDGKVLDVVTSNTVEHNGAHLFGAAAATAADATATHGNLLADFLPELFGSSTASSTSLLADLASLF